jgi:tetratricopeptide (TPR) repeat protein
VPYEEKRPESHKKDPRVIRILKEIKRLRKRLYKARHEFKHANSLNYKNYLKFYMDDLKARIGWLLMDCGEYEKGLTLYQALSWRTHGEEKYNGLCRALVEMENYGEATRLLERGLKRFPESGCLLVATGLLNKRLGNNYEALKCFEYALELYPENTHVLYNKSLALNDLGCYEEAAEILNPLLEDYPDDPDCFVEMGYSILSQGYPEEAVQFYKKAYETGCLHPGIYEGLYCSYIDLGLQEEALEIAEEGLREFPDIPGMYENLGHCYFERGWIDEARDLLQEGIRKFPDDERLRDLLKEIEDEEDDPDRGPLPMLIALIIQQIRSYRNG